MFTIPFPSLIASLYPNKIIYELAADIPLPIFAIQIIRLWYLPMISRVKTTNRVKTS